MQKLKRTLVIGSILAAPLMAGSTASAATCQVGYTGPDSNNLCTMVTTYTCAIDNNNQVTVDNGNTQVAVSGNGSTGGNGNGGDAQTGSATNQNGVTFDVTVQNGTCEVLASVAPTPDVVKDVEVKEAVPAPKVAPAPVLARTSADSTATVVMAVLGGTVAGVAAL